MRDNELSPEQEAELEQLASEAIREAERVGVDWDVAAERMRALASEKWSESEDGMSGELTLELDLSLLLRTLRRLPDGAGTERFLAAYEAADADPDSPAS
jgi:hypothetical protein